MIKLRSCSSDCIMCLKIEREVSENDGKLPVIGLARMEIFVWDTNLHINILFTVDIYKYCLLFDYFVG